MHRDLPGLALQGCFISAEAIEREVGQIGETRKAARKISGGIDGRLDNFRPRAGLHFCSARGVVRCRIETDRVSPRPTGEVGATAEMTLVSTR